MDLASSVIDLIRKGHKHVARAPRKPWEKNAARIVMWWWDLVIAEVKEGGC